MVDTTSDLLNNTQGDILIGLPKQTETFLFFAIRNAALFRTHLAQLTRYITSTKKVIQDQERIDAFRKAHPNSKELLKVSGINIAFSATGIKQLGIKEIETDPFTNGMKKDAKNLHDGQKKDTEDPDWDNEFLNPIHGVILITGESHSTAAHVLDIVRGIFGIRELLPVGHSSPSDDCSITEIATLVGDVRPGEQRGHEHFGWKDGVSQPLVKDIPGLKVDPNNQMAVGKDVILVANASATLPSWTVDGSFLVFRKLSQLVPEFNKFLTDAVKDHPKSVSDVALGARLVGRFKSGALIEQKTEVDPMVKDGDDLTNFTFKSRPHLDCPFASHIRKMNPRDTNPSHPIIRRGIPFGKEVTSDEEKSHTTKSERGLYFVCYQSDLSQGFQFLQQFWANNKNFPPPGFGFDAIIGQSDPPESRTITGVLQGEETKPLSLPKQWVVSRGGEYFFSPSISALQNTFCVAPTPAK